MKIFYILILIAINNIAFSQRFDTIYVDQTDNYANNIDYDYYKIIEQKNANTFDVSEYYRGDSLRSSYTLVAKGSGTVTNKNILKLISKNKLIKDGEQSYFLSDTILTKKLYWKLGVISFGPVYYQDNSVYHIINNDTIYSNLDLMPKFQGGNLEDFRNYVQTNVIYPEIAKKHGVQGQVKVQFIVYKDGSIRNPMIVKGVDPSLDMQAYKTVKESPNWTPGYHRNRPVSVQFVMPINFVLE